MFLLIGNPNVGKTTLFNQLTKSSLHTGNFSGVTVEKEAAVIINTKKLLVDLPGIYSFLSKQQDEKITLKAILASDYEGIIQVIDATHLKQGLQLTLQLMELKKPLIVILNMKDELEKKGLTINEKLLSFYLDVDILLLQASKMIKKDYQAFKKNLDKIKTSSFTFNYGSVESLISKHFTNKDAYGRFMTITQTASIQEALYVKRQELIDYLYNKVVIKKGIVKSPLEMFDSVLLNPTFGTFCFLLIMLLCYQLSFGSGILGVGYRLRMVINDLYFHVFLPFIKASYYQGGIINGSFIDGLLSEGIFGGIGSIIVFLPQIILLYFLLYLLEGTGYLARVMVATDYLLARWGLSGSSIVPMVLGIGCSVPAILACRRIENSQERRLTMLLIPFISCSARLPVYAMLVSVFFSQYQALIILALYLLGIIVVLFSAKFFSLTLFKAQKSEFILEMPPYRKVSVKALIKEIKKRVGSFLKKAGSIILVGSILLWVLTYNPYQQPEHSFLGFWAKQMSFIFSPLGFGSWQNVIALVTGFMAKETIISSFNLLYQLNGDFTLLNQYFTPLDAICFLVFISLYVPCLATIATIKQESTRRSDVVIALIYPLIFSYLIALIVRSFGQLFF